MITFDDILPKIHSVLEGQTEDLSKIGRLFVNRDLNGVVRLIVDERFEANKEVKNALDSIVAALTAPLEGRLAKTNQVIYEASLDTLLQNVPHFDLSDDIPGVTVIDRLLTESDWTNIAPSLPGSHRIVFYSIKGGVGRSTALAATAWALAEEGKKVLVVDLDLESPGLSDVLLPKERMPVYGVTDWLLEDLSDNSHSVLLDMIASSSISRNGEVYVVPAHGKNPGEYIPKLGRAWMSKTMADNSRELWQERLNRLLKDLENARRPDVVLIDARAGIDEVSAACITAIGAELILLFAVDSDQTWSGYDILFQHWTQSGSAQNIRERLQIIGALVPETNRQEYIDSLCEHAWNLFSRLYDKVPPGELSSEYFNYDKSDIEAPHYPVPVMWNRGFFALPNLYLFLQTDIREQINNVFGRLIALVKGVTDNG